jgi:hypothetical protein
MSDLKIVADPDASEPMDGPRTSVPVPVNDAALNRRDLDMIKRDLITVRKDYREIRDNMVVLTHQYSRAPSRSFFITFGIVWLALLAALLFVQPHLSSVTERLAALVSRH